MIRRTIILASFLFVSNLHAQQSLQLEAYYTFGYFQKNYSKQMVSRPGVAINIGISSRVTFSLGLNLSHFSGTLYRYDIYHNYFGFGTGIRYDFIKKKKDSLGAAFGFNFNSLRNYSEEALRAVYGKFYVPSMSPELNFALRYEHDFTENWGIGISPTWYTYLLTSQESDLNFGGASFSVLYTL